MNFDAAMKSDVTVHCANLGGFNCQSQKWFNIVYLDEEGPPQKFWSHTTTFSFEKLSFFHFFGHENEVRSYIAQHMFGILMGIAPPKCFGAIPPLSS